MFPKVSLLIFSGFYAITTLMWPYCAAQMTTVRPYQFGFTIEEQQHRFEKRDERGIVMGEFGFITADGIYHVTVYATDEQGRFRILAMKNYPYESPPKTIDMMVIPERTTSKPITSVGSPITTTPLPQIDFGQKACSGCFLPKKGSNSVDKQETTPKTEKRPLSKAIGAAGTPLPNGIAGRNYDIEKMVTDIAKAATDMLKQNKNTNTNTKQYNKNTQQKPPTTDAGFRSPKKIETQTPSKLFPTNVKTGPGPTTRNTGNVNANTPSLNKPKQLNPKKSSTNSGSGSGTGRAAKAQPNDNAIGDTGDLYRFKYILDYNGHTETGSRNGNKVGSFYSIGDDNVERSIEYVANELGFQPRIHWRKLDPNEIKSKENTLKDYEFVWFKAP